MRISFIFQKPDLNLNYYADKLIFSLKSENPQNIKIVVKEMIIAAFNSSKVKALSIGIKKANSLVLPEIIKETNIKI